MNGTNVSTLPSFPGRLCETVDRGWKFLQKDLPGAEAPDFDDSGWRVLDLPHDWSIEGEYSQGNPSGGSGGFLPTGIGWYRKKISLPREWREGRRVSLCFDGVFCNSTVYADGVPVGGMAYGWLSFFCDVTEQARGKEELVIAVKVDNSVQPAARWYTGSGIYSHVRLLSTDPVCVGRDGVFVSVGADEKGVPTGDLKAEVRLCNHGASDRSVILRSRVIRLPDGEEAGQTDCDLVLPAGAETTAEQLLSVQDPLLWDTETPNLYFLRTEILSDGHLLDRTDTRFGFRTVRWSVDGFFLNGKPFLMKGVSCHWALGALGAAQPDGFIRYKIRMMQSMGANCIRTSHNACPPIFYDLCDEMGMTVMDELFEGERGKTAGDYGTRFFPTHWKTDVEAWIRRDRNHPSVILWSIGNETGSRKDNTGISAYIKKFDTTRPTTGSWIFEGVDIPGANGASERKEFAREDETLPLIATEAPHTHAVRGVYRTRTWFRGNDSDGSDRGTFVIPHLAEKEIFRYDWDASAVGPRILPSDYDNAISQISVRKHWTLTRDLPWRLGEFRWTGFDYLGEANYVLGGWPYRMFHSGAVDSALFPKSMYYLYQSMWTKEPMIHILPSWTHPTVQEGTPIPVWAYSNCESVELFLNGESLGIVHRGPMDLRPEDRIQFEWSVPYEPGTLKAVGYGADGQILAETRQVTAKAPRALVLKSEEGLLPEDPAALGQVSVSLTDGEGTFYPYGENRIFFHLSGPGELRAVDNGSPTDVECHRQTHRRAFMGLAKAYVTPSGEAGDLILTAAAILGERRLLTENTVSVDVKQLSLRGNPAGVEFEIFVTDDGSLPSRNSRPYTGPFAISPGTRVRAAIYRKGEEEPLLLPEETFGADCGLFWADRAIPTAKDRYSVADARISGPFLRWKTYGYNDRYVDFAGTAGEVSYTVDADRPGIRYCAVCYNYAGAVGDGCRVRISVNGTDLEEVPFLHNGPKGKVWSFRMVRVFLQPGKNILTLSAPVFSDLCLKELILWPEEQVLPVGLGTAAPEGTRVKCGSSFLEEAFDPGKSGGISWEVRRPAGTYLLRVAYSTPRGSLREVSASVNGTPVACWSGSAVSGDYGSAWGFFEKEISLSAGKNTVTVFAPSGGAFFGGLVLEPKGEDARRTCRISLSCEDHTFLFASRKEIFAGAGEGLWDLYTDAKGRIRLVCKENGLLLAGDGEKVFLAEGEEQGNALWSLWSEMEDYEYLVHTDSGKILALGADGGLSLAERSLFDDSDRTSNRAYWRFRREDKE